jgi:hypothetical protein
MGSEGGQGGWVGDRRRRVWRWVIMEEERMMRWVVRRKKMNSLDVASARSPRL